MGTLGACLWPQTVRSWGSSPRRTSPGGCTARARSTAGRSTAGHDEPVGGAWLPRYLAMVNGRALGSRLGSPQTRTRSSEADAVGAGLTRPRERRSNWRDLMSTDGPDRMTTMPQHQARQAAPPNP